MKTFVTLLATALAVFAGASFGSTSAELPGRIETFALKGGASGMEAEVQVYLPPGYDDSKDSFAVMYFLHGSGGVSGIKILAGFSERAVAEKLCRPFIIVEPKGPQTPHCWWVDAPATDSKAGTLVSQDLIPAVDRRYRTLPRREGRIIAGFSMGGFGALAQLFQHPELFATGVAYDGGFAKDAQFDKEHLRQRFEKLFAGDAGAFLATAPQGRAAQYAGLPAEQRPPVDYQLLTGEFRERIETFQQQLEKLGVAQPGRIIVTSAGHNLGQVLEQSWREHFRFLGGRLAGPTGEHGTSQPQPREQP
jgi:predicted esterase